MVLFDEIKIQENLIGFLDLGDVNLNYATLQETNAIASRVLVFLL